MPHRRPDLAGVTAGVPQPDTDTGRRVHFALDGMPRNVMNTPIAVTEYNRSDGFSPGASILLHVPNVDLAMTGAAPRKSRTTRCATPRRLPCTTPWSVAMP